jgi:hypothetical protein
MAISPQSPSQEVRRRRAKNMHTGLIMLYNILIAQVIKQFFAFDLHLFAFALCACGPQILDRDKIVRELFLTNQDGISCS